VHRFSFVLNTTLKVVEKLIKLIGGYPICKEVFYVIFNSGRGK